MKIVFVGPSLSDAAAHAASAVDVRGPARQGDVAKAVRDGATVIGLIDGFFEMVAPVWHKELLFALSEGVAVLGAASMGALRAAECAHFGMTGVGRIFNDYASGMRVDDGDVALLHGPGEIGYPSLTVPIVNVDASLEHALRQQSLTPAEAAVLSQSARSIFYKSRTWKSILDHAFAGDTRIASIVKASRVDQKRLDALMLMAEMNSPLPDIQSQREWTFHSTPLWRRLYPPV